MAAGAAFEAIDDGIVSSLFSSCPGSSRPSTSFVISSKDVDARHTAGHDEVPGQFPAEAVQAHASCE
jgi:hypothetical protein